MTRVVMITQDYLPLLGGAERQIAALAPLFKERQIEVQVVTRRYPGLAAFECIGDVPVYRLPFIKVKSLASLAFTSTALPLIKKLKPDILHAHGLLSPTTTAVTAKRLMGMPVVSKSLRGGILGDFERLMHRRGGRLRFQAFQQYVDAFITISQEIRNELIAQDTPPEKCQFIPNGVRLDKFKPVDVQQKKKLREQLQLPDGPIVIFVGRLEREKRIGDLVSIWHRIEEKIPDAHLLILGSGSQEKMLHEMAAGNIIFKGAVEDVAPYLQAADVFVLPSVAEGLSNALLEALAAGLPVVATTTGGTTDIVRHKISGWLIHNYEPEALIEGILAFMNDIPLREACAREGRRYVMANYSLTSTADKLCQLYKDLLSK